MAIMRDLLTVCLVSASAFAQSETLGAFTNSCDVGGPVIKGSTVFNAAGGQYKVTGGGANIWAKQDQFQYVWREMAGNFSVTATVRFLGEGVAHRKAGIVVRQGLETDGVNAGVIVHGNGMPALQWRSRAGENTNVFDLPFDSPGVFKMKLVRNGIRIYMFLGKDGAPMKEINHTEVAFQNPVLAGLVVCSHKADASDTVVFSDVSIEELAPSAPRKQ